MRLNDGYVRVVARDPNNRRRPLEKTFRMQTKVHSGRLVTKIMRCTRKKIRSYFAPWLLSSFLAVCAYAETGPTIADEENKKKIANVFQGQKLIIIADEKARDDATSYAKAFHTSLKEQGIGLEPSVLLSAAGSFSISLGSLEVDRCDEVVAELAGEGIVPQNASCSSPDGFVALFRVEGDALIPVLGLDFTATEAEQEIASRDEPVATPDDDATGMEHRFADHAKNDWEDDVTLDDMRDMSAGKRTLGETLVELGSISEIGFWLYTELVDTDQSGWVKDDKDTILEVELRPLNRENGALSQLSLEAMLTLNLPLSRPSRVQVLVPVSEKSADDVAAEEPQIASPSQTTDLDRPFVQVGTFRVEANALATRDQMQAAGLAVMIKPARIHDDDFWRVIVGPVENSAARKELFERVRNMGFNDAFSVSR